MASIEDFDVVVVGAGMGGIYAVHKFLQEGLKVVALERDEHVGGVWNHNRYPGARVDGDSTTYSFTFSAELYREWKWSQRYAPQPELFAYFNHVVEKFGLRPHIRVNNPLTSAEWRPDEQRYHLRTGDGSHLRARFLVLATGNLSAPRDMAIPGLENFKGQVLRTSRWPKEPIDFKGKRVGIIGTGSTGVQSTTVLAHEAAHLTVFQRNAHYAVPAMNGPLDEARYNEICENPRLVMDDWRRGKLFQADDGTRGPLGAPKKGEDYTPEEQQQRLENQWNIGGQRFHVVFADQTTNKATNDVVSEFVRNKIRKIVKDPALAEKLCPKYPVGTRRLIQADGYYEAFNRDNVSLVDITENPIETMTATGVKTGAGHYEVDVLLLALGFKAFVGEINQIDIRNEKGETPTTHWARGPRTLFGLMTAGFPNLFTPTGAGSLSVLANLFTQNEYHIDWIADCIRHLDEKGYASIEPEVEAQDRWTDRVSEQALKLLRLQGNDYMVHRNEDGTRVFIPWAGGASTYVQALEEATANGYEGFRMARASDVASARSTATAESA